MAKLYAFIFFIIPSLFFSVETKAQLISFSPDFPTETSAITLTFDAAKGSLGLKNCGCAIYMHTGVITDKSTSASDWKYVKHSSFNLPYDDVKLTDLGNDKFSIVINNPKSFYGVPDGEKILKLSMVFRNANGSKETKNTDNSDIYMPIYQPGEFALRITQPEFEPKFLPTPLPITKAIGESLTVTAISSQTAALNLKINNVNFATTNAQSINGNAVLNTAGNQTITATAVSGSVTKEQSFSFVVNNAVTVAELPAGAKDGVVFLNNGTSALFTLFAPFKTNVYVIGDFNNWQPETSAFMKKTPDGKRWWVQIDNLTPTTEYAYQFLVDGNLRIADPYAEKVLDPDNDRSINPLSYPNLKAYPTGKTSGIVSVLQPVQTPYNWQVQNFVRPKKTDLVIYELLVRDFIARHDYQTLKDTLGYLKNLGINAIELMPVSEFEGNESWGYNVSYHLALDKYYGTKNAFKAFIDECHKNGIAVILDVVLNHAFGQNPNVRLYFDGANGRPAANSPWFNVTPTHPFNVGYDFNHEAAATKEYSKRVMEYWINEYKIDGYRFDLSKGFTQKNSGTSDAAVGPWGAYDASRVAIWKEYYDFIKSKDNNNFYTILEHFADNQEEKELSDYGLMFWGNSNYAYNEATMGYLSNSNFDYGYYQKRGWANPNLVTYMESHDEERLMFKNISFGNVNASYSTKEVNTALKRMEMAAAFFLLQPGPKMIWQFGERGYDLSINFPSNTANDRLSNKPPRWEYMDDANRKQLYTTYSKLNKLRIAQPVFESQNVTLNFSGAIKTLKINDAINVFVIGNFDVAPQNVNADVFPTTGMLYDYLSGDSIIVGNSARTFQPGEFHVYSSINFNSPGINTAIKDDVLVKDGLYFYNYPNPVNGETIFTYNLKNPDFVKLNIFDLSGKEVSKLLNQKQSSGEYEFKWSNTGQKQLNPGIYLANLQIGAKSKTIKMVIR